VFCLQLKSSLGLPIYLKSFPANTRRFYSKRHSRLISLLPHYFISTSTVWFSAVLVAPASLDRVLSACASYYPPILSLLHSIVRVMEKDKQNMETLGEKKRKQSTDLFVSSLRSASHGCANHIRTLRSTRR
jgi:hypothetical protein